MIEITIGIAVVAVLLGTCWALSANRSIKTAFAGDRYEYDVAAAKKIYQGALVGLHYVTGYARPYELGDVFVGIALYQADNSSGAAGAIRCTVVTRGRFRHTVYDAAGSAISLTRAYIGRCVYATDDGTIKLSGNALGYAGRIVAIDGTTAIIELKHYPIEMPDDSSSTAFAIGNAPWNTTTGDNATLTAFNESDGIVVSSTLGLGITPQPDGWNKAGLDATNEASTDSIYTPFQYPVGKGLVFDVEVAGYATSGNVLAAAEVDFDCGLADTITVTNVDPTRHVRVHVDGNDSNNILVGADDNSTDVAEADTGINLSATSGTFNRIVFIVRGTSAGQTEVWVDGVQVTTPSLASIAFASGNMAAFVNLEKSGGTGVAVVEVRRFALYGGR